MKYSASEIAEQVGGEVVGNGDTKLIGFAQADVAKPGDLTFAEDEKFFRLAEQSEASAILATDQFSSDNKTVIRVKNARVAFARVLPFLFPEKQFGPGTHPSAVIAESAQVDGTAHIGPNCVIGENAVIGPQAILEANCILGDQSSLGQAVRLFPNVTIYPQSRIGDRVRIHSASVVGSDGYGYVFDEGHHRKIPQIGGVVIGNDVEIGASVTIDRGALGNILNLPLPKGSGSDEYFAALRDKALPFLLDPEPDCLLVCSGYDALEPDPLATMTLQPSDFAQSVDAILARYPRTRVALGLEGGYALGAGGMPEAFTETCRALVDGA